MLILSRKLNESIVIDGRITVKIVRIDRETVKLGIVAPSNVPVHRQEVYDEIRKSNQEALAGTTESVPRLSTDPGIPPTPSATNGGGMADPSAPKKVKFRGPGKSGPAQAPGESGGPNPKDNR